MKLSKKIIFSFILANLTIFSLTAESLKIDYRINTVQNDSKDYVTWTLGKEKNADFFDAETSASKKQTTKKFPRYDENKTLILPAGLRSLMLFAVAPDEAKEQNHLSVEKEGKKLTITFCRHGKAVKIETDKKGKISVKESFYKATVAKKNEQGTLTYSSEVIFDGSDANDYESVDWNLVKYEKDTPKEDTENAFKGTLKTSFKDGILTVKGILKR